MKIAILGIVVLCAVGAVAQATSGVAVMSSQPVVYEFSSHPQLSAPGTMAAQQSLLRDGYSYARGEKPLWEVKVPEPTPLGDVARAVRKQHESAKKSDVVWTN